MVNSRVIISSFSSPNLSRTLVRRRHCDVTEALGGGGGMCFGVAKAVSEHASSMSAKIMRNIILATFDAR